MTAFNTDAFRKAFKIWHTKENNSISVDYGRAEHTAYSVDAWPIMDAGRHENKKGIYFGVLFGNVDENERRYVSFNLTRKQLQKMLDAVDARYNPIEETE